MFEHLNCSQFGGFRPSFFAQFQFLYSEKPGNRNGNAETLNLTPLCVQMWRPHVIHRPFQGELEPPGSRVAQIRGAAGTPPAAWGQEGLRPEEGGKDLSGTRLSKFLERS